MEEEHSVFVRPGDDPCVGVAVFDCSVASGCREVGQRSYLVY